MAQPTFPYLGVFPPQPDVSTGTSFTDGVRVGRIPIEQNGNSTGAGLVPIGGISAASAISPQFLRWGEGMGCSPIVTYNICPYLAWPDNGTPTVPPDICLFPAGTASGAYATLTPAVNIPNTGITWPVSLVNLSNYFVTAGYGFNPASPNNGLRLDWPRALGIYISGAPLTDTTSLIRVWGFDFWGNPMMAQYGGVSSSVDNGLLQGVNATVGGIPTIYQYSPVDGDTVTNKPSISANYTNKAFYIISAVQYVSTAGTAIPTGATVSVVTTRTMGLPYLFDSQRCSLLAIAWNGTSELSGMPLAAYTAGAPLGLAGVPPVNTVYPGTDGNVEAFLIDGAGPGSSGTDTDVRGTYTPSIPQPSPSANCRLLISWVASNVDPILSAMNAAYLSEPFGEIAVTPQGTQRIVAKPTLNDWIGGPQYAGPS